MLQLLLSHKTTSAATGGDVLDAKVNSSSMAAAQEAASGLWLQQLESKELLPRAVAPGLSRGVFGSWAIEDEAYEQGGLGLGFENQLSM